MSTLICECEIDSSLSISFKIHIGIFFCPPGVTFDLFGPGKGNCFVQQQVFQLWTFVRLKNRKQSDLLHHFVHVQLSHIWDVTAMTFGASLSADPAILSTSLSFTHTLKVVWHRSGICLSSFDFSGPVFRCEFWWLMTGLISCSLSLPYWTWRSDHFRERYQRKG